MEFDAPAVFEELFVKPFDELHQVLRNAKAHFDVDLGELGLTVCAHVLIAEALGDLEIAVHPSDHEQLLEDLRRFGKAVEIARIGARRDEKMSGAAGSGLAENGGLDF